MNEQDKRRGDMRPAGPAKGIEAGSVEERNIERLLRRAYDPEEPNETFAAQMQAEMLAAARDEAAGARRRRAGWLLRVAAAAAAVAVGFAVGRKMAPKAPPRVPMATVGVEPPGAGPVPLTVLGGPERAIPVENLLRPRPRPRRVAAQRLSPGSAVTTDERGRRRIALLDGSELYVNGGTSLRITGPRAVRLDRGEVYVIVAPAPAFPGRGATFVVHTPRRTITATGTRFGVRVDDGETSVAVTQGTVRVSGFAGVVEAGQQLRPDADRVVPLPRATHVLDWTRDLVAAAQSPLVPRSKHAGGALVAKDDAGDVKLSLRRLHVDAHLEDGFARTTIDQTYFNHTGRRLEGTFYFPLPADASLSRLAMYVNGKLMEGGMVERTRARQVFQDIVNKMLDPALLEWMDGTTFKMRVFPLEPRQEKRIILSYTQQLASLYGRTSYRFPAGHSMEKVGTWSFRARVRHGAAFEWACDSHEMTADTDGDDLFLTAEAKDARADTDVVLRLHDAGAEAADGGEASARFSSATHEHARYLALHYRPELPAGPRPRQRHWVFLFESSADRDPLLARAQIEVVRGILSAAGHDDTFCLVTAGTRAKVLADEPLAASPENVERAMAFLDGAHLIGALDLEQALAVAGELCRLGDSAHLVHVGSGIPALGQRDRPKLLERLPAGATYVGVGVGKRWARDFMKAAAARTGGHFTQINPDENVAWRALEVAATLNTPRLLKLRVTGEPDGRAFVPCQDALAQGEVLCAILRTPDSAEPPKAIRVEGTLDGEDWTAELPVRDVAEKADYLPRIWARQEIDRLLAENPAKNRPRVVELSKAMYVMSPFTSLLVLENEQMYQQYKVDRGRKDHWALYPCPERIPVVREPRRPGGEKAKPSPEPLDKKRARPSAKPWRKAVLRTVLVRSGPPVLQPADRPQSTPDRRVRTIGAIDGSRLAIGSYDTLSYVGGFDPDDNAAHFWSWVPGYRVVDVNGRSDYYALGVVDLSGAVGGGTLTTDWSVNLPDVGVRGQRIFTTSGDEVTYVSHWTRTHDRSARDGFLMGPVVELQDGGFRYANAGWVSFSSQVPSVWSVELSTDERRFNNFETTVIVPDGGTLLVGGQVVNGDWTDRTFSHVHLWDPRTGLWGRDDDGAGVVDDLPFRDVNAGWYYVPSVSLTPSGRTLRGLRGTEGTDLRVVDPLSVRGHLTTLGTTTLVPRDPGLVAAYEYNLPVLGHSPVASQWYGEDRLVADDVALWGDRVWLFRPRRRAASRSTKRPTGGHVRWNEYLRYPKSWGELARERGFPALRPGESPEDVEVREKLQRRIERFTFADIDFKDVVQFLREYSGVNIHVSWRALTAGGIEKRTKVSVDVKDIPVQRALELVLADVGAAAAGADAEPDYTIDGGVLTISPRADLSRKTTRRVYDIRDLLVPAFGTVRGRTPRTSRTAADVLRRAQSVPRADRTAADVLRRVQSVLRVDKWADDRGPERFGELFSGDFDAGWIASGGDLWDEGGSGGFFEAEEYRERQEGEEITKEKLTEEFVKLVRNAIDRDSWGDEEGGGPGTGFIQVLNGRLVVSQTAGNHREVAELLQQMRAARGRAAPTRGREVPDSEARGRVDVGVRFAGPPRTRTYQRPVFSGRRGCFDDLTLYAPGLNTHRADVLAALEAAGPPADRPKRGHVAHGARVLIDKARAAGWRTVSFPGRDDGLTRVVKFSAAGEYVVRRATSLGLIEKVVCNGHSLLHLYPEIGLAGRRAVSRFHRRQLSAALPWIALPAEDLAIGADVSLGPDRTVVVTPLPARQGAPSPRRALHLRFAPDGRLAERRLVGAEGRLLLRQVLSDAGRVQWLDGDGRVLATADCRLRPTDAPDLKPKLDELVVLPLPHRTPKHVVASRGLNGRLSASWAKDAATAYVSAAVAAGQEYHRWIARRVLHSRFLDRGDRRVGLYVLLRAAGSDEKPPKELTARHVARYLEATGRDAPSDDATFDYRQFGFHDEDFLVRLAGFRRLWLRLRDGETRRDKGVAKAWCRAALAYLDRTGETALSWALLAEAARLVEAGACDPMHAELAGAFERFGEAPGLASFARYEAARFRLRAGKRKEAAKQFRQLHRAAAARGMPLWFDEALHQATKGSGWRELIVESASKLLKAGDRPTAVELAWHCRRVGDAALGAELLALARRDAPANERGPMKLAAVKYYCREGQWARAEALLDETLQDKRLAGVPALWLTAARIAAVGGRTAKALSCHERALDLTYRRLGETANLRTWRARFARLLGAYAGLARATASPRGEPPRELLVNVVRTADRWRALEADPTAACHAAAKALRRAGARELAWEYLTTPLAAKPTEAKPWVKLAGELAGEGETELADRAYTTAFELDPTDPKTLWNRAQLLQQHGKAAEARRLYEQIAAGTWTGNHRAVQRSAQRLLRP